MKYIFLEIQESQEDCELISDCEECYYYSEFNSIACEMFLEDLNQGDTK